MKCGVAGAVSLAAALVVGAAHPGGAAAAFKNVEVGQRPPPFAMKDGEGRLWESATLLDRGVAVVVFWASWSPRSREILEDLERLRVELGPERLAVVAVNVEHLVITPRDREVISTFVESTKSSAVVLLDEGLVAFNAYGTMAVPSSLVVDAQGRVAFTLAGYPMTLRSDLADAVRKALGLPTSVELRPPPEYVPKNHALMYYNFGRRLLEKGQDEKALEQLRIAMERDPAFKKPYIELGLLLVRSGEAEQARQLFVKALEIDPDDSEAIYQAAAASLRAGRFKDAEALFARLAADFPDQGGYRLAHALTQKLLSNEEQYRDGVAAAAGLRPAAPRLLYDLGVIAESRGLLPIAADLYRRSLEASLRRDLGRKP